MLRNWLNRFAGWLFRLTMREGGRMPIEVGCVRQRRTVILRTLNAQLEMSPACARVMAETLVDAAERAEYGAMRPLPN